MQKYAAAHVRPPVQQNQPVQAPINQQPVFNQQPAYNPQPVFMTAQSPQILQRQWTNLGRLYTCYTCMGCMQAGVQKLVILIYI